MLSTEEQLANETKFRSQEHKRISDMEKAHLEMEKRMRDISDQVKHMEEAINNNQIAASTQRS